MLNVIAPYSATATAEGGGKTVQASARRFDATSSSKKGTKQIHLVYDENGAVTEDSFVPPDPLEKRAPVAPEQKKGSYDPLSYVLAVREKLHEALQQHQTAFDVTIYDGKRLAETHYTIMGKTSLQVGQTATPAIALRGTRTPKAGYTAKELNRMQGEPPMTAYLSDDAQLVPLLLVVQLPLGNLNASLDQQCNTDGSCRQTGMIPVPAE
jgi:hypothetical protein